MNWQNHVMKGLVLGVLALMAISAAAPADTVYVNGTCGNDGWTGQSEVCAAPDGPKKTIQAGLDVASNGDEVVLADGVYMGPSNRDLSFGGKLLTLRSVGGPEKCVIDCDASGRGFEFVLGEPLASTLDGLTIRNGAEEIGAAVYCDLGSSVTLTRCILHANAANGPGGAIYAREGSDVTMIDCTLSANSALAAGAAFVYDGDLVVVASRVIENHAGSGGAGLWPTFGQFTIANSLIAGNISGFHSAGLTVGSPALIANCSITGNRAAFASGVYVLAPSEFINCSIGHNSGEAGELSASTSLTNSVVWGNDPIGFGGGATPTVAYSDIEGGWPGEGNIDVNPLFVQPGSYDLALSFGSPCVDVGLTTALPPDEFDLDGDGDLAEPIPYDAAGNPRVQGAAVDMGAYEGEYKPLPPQASVLDLGPGETAFLVPMGGSFNPVESSAAVVTNGSTTTAEVTMTQYAEPVHPFAGTYSELGATMAMQATLAPGIMQNRVFIAFTVAELVGRDPLSLDLTSFNPATGNWRLAVEGNFAPSPGHEGPVGDRIAAEGTGLDWGLTAELGDYGVFWNPVLQKGFVWANLDYAADFALGTPLCYADCSPPNGDGVVNGIDLQALLAAWGVTSGGIFDINLDGVVNGIDLALLLGAWGGCEGGVAPITAPQKVIAPNWGRVVTASQREVDLDGNGEIDARDMSLILAAWSGDQPASAESNAADLNGDGRVNRDDIDALLRRR